MSALVWSQQQRSPLSRGRLRPLWIVALAILTTLVLAAPASARHLGNPRAVWGAKWAAYEYANMPPTSNQYVAGNCRPLAARKQRCVIASYTLPTSETYGEVCVAWTDVWLDRWSSDIHYHIYLDIDECWTYNPQVREAPLPQWNWVYTDPLSAWPTADIHPITDYH